jgi:hypothetical protein
MTTFVQARIGVMWHSSHARDNGAEVSGYRRRLFDQSLMMALDLRAHKKLTDFLFR